VSSAGTLILVTCYSLTGWMRAIPVSCLAVGLPLLNYLSLFKDIQGRTGLSIITALGTLSLVGLVVFSVGVRPSEWSAVLIIGASWVLPLVLSIAFDGLNQERTPAHRKTDPTQAND
jgi:hypothetical protein